MTLRLFIAGIGLWALTATAAGQVDALRATAASSRTQVVELRSEQMAKRSELSTLSARIEALKAKHPSTLSPAGAELDAALKRSQELSGVLSGLAQRMALFENELTTSNLALLEALSSELARARADFDRQTDRAARRASISKMKQLRLEREAIRAALPVTQVPSLDGLKPSDDPEELLEQAELLRDNEEKLAKELKSVETRLAERREEQDLDRRVQRFLGEESMFDDQDRRLRLQQTTTLGASSTPTARSTEATPTSGLPGVGSSSPAAQSDAFSTGGVDSSGIRVSSAVDARPVLGADPAIRSNDGDDVGGLDAQRQKLQRLVDELKAKASSLEKRASQLK